MFVPHVAIEPLPSHAEIEQDTLMEVLRHMTEGDGALRKALEGGFREMELRQPALAAYLSAELSELDHPTAQTLSYFLFVVIYLSFSHSFGPRLGAASDVDIELCVERLIMDGELRHSGAARDSYSEDVVALGQPALMRLLRSEIERAIDELPNSSAWKTVDPLYEALLVEILVLTQGVAPMQ